jgi:uncharacterized membrane protein
MKKTVKGLLAILITAVAACGISFLLYRYIVEGGIYPSGEDVYYHLFRGDLLFKAILKGDAYPLYSGLWYNGIQPLRYTPPLSVVLFALCELYTGGQIYIAYVIYCCAIFVVGQIVWTVAGFRTGRPILGALIGILWFFSPVNMQVLFSHGNLALSLCNCIAPLLFVAVCEYLESGRVTELFSIICISCFMILSHTGMTLLYFLLIFMFMLVQRFFSRNRRRILKVIIAFAISFLCCGLYTVPSLIGGYDFAQADKAGSYFQEIFKTIDPLAVLKSRDAIYFGLPLLVIAILGVVVSNKKSSPIFLSAIIALLLTSSTACIMISIIPGAEMLWLIRLLPGAAAFIYLGMIYWKKLRKWILAVFL